MSTVKNAHFLAIRSARSLDEKTMNWLKLPPGKDKPTWASLFGAVPMAYVFVDPYQRHAPPIEWMWTGLAFAIFLVLYTVGALCWSRRQVVLYVCIAMAALAVAFTAYRPGGVIFFIMVAVFGAVAAGGNIARSAMIIVAVILLILGEWWLLWPPGFFPYVAAAQSFLIAGAITGVLRQGIALKRFHKEVERERIARDLHDILGHTLSVIILKSELASRLLEQDPQRAKAEIEDVERISRNALSEVREAIVGYRAGDLLAEFDRAKSTLDTAGIVVEHHWEEVGMPVSQERVLALVLREAVTNVLRHAQAKRCRMALQKTAGGCRLQVRDDGRGGAHQEGLGMRGIRERVAAIGGKVSWNAGPGTELTITVPIAADAGGEIR